MVTNRQGNNVCPRCKERQRESTQGGYCGSCRRDYDREYRLRVGYHKERQFRRHGITRETFDLMLAAQHGGCAICGTDKPGGVHERFVIDHDHACCPGGKGSCGGCVRGLLCGRCNTAIGLLDDDPARLAAAINYLGALEHAR